jgi:TPR repeat protein
MNIKQLLIATILLLSSGAYGQSFEETKLLAEQGDANAQYNLGNMYIYGNGVPENDVEAVKWHRLAAEQGQVNAQYNLGNMYLTGNFVPENYVEALKWHRLAAEQGYAKAQTDLGFMYENGDGVPENYVKAYVWYSVSAAQGDDVGKNLRDFISERLTRDQLARGQEIATKCFESDYQDCE